MKLESFAFDAAPPYPAGVSVAELLTEIEAVIKKHVVLSDEAAAALAVWVLHTYTFELRALCAGCRRIHGPVRKDTRGGIERPCG